MATNPPQVGNSPRYRKHAWGPGSSLHNYITERLGEAGSPTLRPLEEWIEAAQNERRSADVRQDATLSKSRLSELRNGQGSAPTFEQVELLNEALALRVLGNRNDYDKAKMAEVFRQSVQPNLDSASLEFASHFLLATELWAMQRAPEGKGVTATICIAQKGPPSPSIAARVFDASFQDDLTQLQEPLIIRRDQHFFHTKLSWLSSGFRVWGNIVESNNKRLRTFIVVEAHTMGAISVFVKDLREETTFDFTHAQLLPRALTIALGGHFYLGSSGPAFAALQSGNLTREDGEQWLRRKRRFEVSVTETTFLPPKGSNSYGLSLGLADEVASRVVEATVAERHGGTDGQSPWTVKEARKSTHWDARDW